MHGHQFISDLLIGVLWGLCLLGYFYGAQPWVIAFVFALAVGSTINCVLAPLRRP
jgi:F0F1-type ATP synthase assembly protein I